MQLSEDLVRAVEPLHDVAYYLHVPQTDCLREVSIGIADTNSRLYYRPPISRCNPNLILAIVALAAEVLVVAAGILLRT